jgi:hypothetical protein
MTTRRLVTSTLLAVALAGGFVRGSDGPKPASTPGPGEPTLSEVRRLTERFRDVKVALAEGYIRDPFDMCETAEMMGRPAALGAMGIHFFRPDLLGITKPPSPRVSGTGTHTDFRQPSILIYEPKADGSLELVAVENLVFASSTFSLLRLNGLAIDCPLDARRGKKTSAFGLGQGLARPKQGLGRYAAPIGALASDQLSLDNRQRQAAVAKAYRDRLCSHATAETNHVEFPGHAYLRDTLPPSASGTTIDAIQITAPECEDARAGARRLYDLRINFGLRLSNVGRKTLPVQMIGSTAPIRDESV